MAVDNNLIILAGSELFSIAGAGEAEPLTLLAQTSLPGAGLGVAIHQDKALVVVGDDYGAAQLLVFDVKNPAEPRQIEAVDIAASQLFRVPILINGSHLVLANGAGGVDVFEIYP